LGESEERSREGPGKISLGGAGISSAGVNAGSLGGLKKSECVAVEDRYRRVWKTSELWGTRSEGRVWGRQESLRRRPEKGVNQKGCPGHFQVPGGRGAPHPLSPAQPGRPATSLRRPQRLCNQTRPAGSRGGPGAGTRGFLSAPSCGQEPGTWPQRVVTSRVGGARRDRSSLSCSRASQRTS
jgi:hypothetical protein